MGWLCLESLRLTCKADSFIALCPRLSGFTRTHVRGHRSMCKAMLSCLEGRSSARQEAPRQSFRSTPCIDVDFEPLFVIILPLFGKTECPGQLPCASRAVQCLLMMLLDTSEVLSMLAGQTDHLVFQLKVFETDRISLVQLSRYHRRCSIRPAHSLAISSRIFWLALQCM